MVNRKVSLITNIVIILLMVAFLIGSIDLSPRARLFPFLIGVPTLLLLLYIFFDEIRKFRSPDDGKKETVAYGNVDFPDAKALLKIIGLLFIFVTSIVLFGFLVGIPLFMFIFFRVYGNIRWWQEILMLVGVTITIYILSQILQSGLFKGIVFGANLPAF